MAEVSTGSQKRFRYYQVVGQDALPEGERLFIEVAGKSIVILNVGGNLFAIDDLCTHDGGPLGDGMLDDHTIACPRHGARFDIRTGKALTLPAYTDIESYPVRTINGTVEIGIPVEDD